MASTSTDRRRRSSRLVMVFTTGPVERSAATERVRVVALNTGSRPVRLTVVIRDLERRCSPGRCRCRCCHDSWRVHPCRPRLLFVRTRLVRPGCTAVFDADLGGTLRYDVRMRTPSGRVLFYVSGYRVDRWWPWVLPDPATTFRHAELVCLGGRTGRSRRAGEDQPARCKRA